MATIPPTYDCMVKRTHKFYLQVQSDDPGKVANLAKDAVKAGKAIEDGGNSATAPKEYDVNFTVKSEPFDPDLIP